MYRARKRRRICSIPSNNKYGPLGVKNKDYINMTLDEYETIRLIDYEGFNQENCALQMNVARTIVQGIYASAREKIAKSLITGKILLIEGGNYQISDHNKKRRCGMGCSKHT